MTYDCMTPEELTLWAMPNVYAPPKSPCFDCPAWFAAAAKERGCCQRERTGRPVSDVNDERRRQWREAGRRRRARAREARYNNECSGSELSVATLRPGPLHS